MDGKESYTHRELKMNWTIDYLYCHFLQHDKYCWFDQWINREFTLHRDNEVNVSEMRTLVKENGWTGKLKESI